MEREEHTLRRKCEDLRLTLDNRTRELSQSQELYSKLKQRVLLSQNQEIPTSVSTSRSPMQAVGSVDAGQGQAHSQLPRPVLPVGARTGVSNYFPASPGYSKPQPSSTTIVEWNKPVFTQRRCYSVFTQS
jgi:E3 ubiquitin-protein ligase CCNP1IP1